MRIFPSPSGGVWVVQQHGNRELRTALLRVITQRIVVTAYRRFGATYRSHSQGPLTTTRCVIIQRNAVFIYVTAEAWNMQGVENWCSHHGEVECSCTELQVYVFITKQSPSLGHSFIWGNKLIFLGMRCFHAAAFCCGVISLKTMTV